MQFANKTQMCFGGRSLALAIDSTGIKYATPALLRETLGDIARLSYWRGRFKGSVRLDAAAASGVLVVRLKSATATYHTETITLSGSATEYVFAADVDMTAAVGAEQLFIELEATTAAPASRTATVLGLLDVEHPVVIGTC